MSKKYDKSLFALVQENDRLKDKPLLTRQLTYFQDAMLRFTKNKYNVIASIILLIMILMSIFVPILTPSRFYETTNSELSTLPPRVPILEYFGIFDGTKQYQNQPVDRDTIDPETGLGYPTLGFEAEFIDFSTLENTSVFGTDKSPFFVGGTVELYVNTTRTSAAVISNEIVTLFAGDYINVDLEVMPSEGVLEIYVSPVNLTSALSGWDDDKLTLLGTVNASGVSRLNEVESLKNGFLILRYVLESPSLTGRDKVVFNSVSLVNGNTNQTNKEFTGYNLSIFTFFILNSVTENGRYLRNGAEMLIASFRYDEYEALFSNKPRTIGANEYNQILLDNPGMAETITVNPNNPDAWTFDEGFPIAEVTSVDRIIIAGREYINYKVEINGRYSLNFEETPYFIFGTDVFGKDLFVLIWLGLRTSLLLGFLATLFNIIIGIIWGATSAYYGGQVDMLMERFTDIWGSFPSITMIGIITVLIGPGFLALFIFVVYDGWIGAAKVTRFQFYRYKGSEYVLAARTLGSSDGRIIFKHILPNALGTIVTRVVLAIPSVIFLEVNLSFLGFGIGNGQTLSIGPIELTGTSIGVILNDGQQQIFAGNLWLVIFPAIIVAVLMITFNMFGNALRDALNPQLRGSE
jgi:oligopeptide transport system permease protein